MQSYTVCSAKNRSGELSLWKANLQDGRNSHLGSSLSEAIHFQDSTSKFFNLHVPEEIYHYSVAMVLERSLYFSFTIIWHIVFISKKNIQELKAIVKEAKQRFSAFKNNYLLKAKKQSTLWGCRAGAEGLLSMQEAKAPLSRTKAQNLTNHHKPLNKNKNSTHKARAKGSCSGCRNLDTR